MKLALISLLIVHGIIHFLGTTKAFSPETVNQIERNISKTNGVLWGVAAVLFISAGLLLLLKQDWWWFLSIVAIIISQYVIIDSWSDAKYGTIFNVILLAATIASYGAWHFQQVYKGDVKTYLKEVPEQTSVLTEADITHLPPAVQKYMRYTGCIDKPKVTHFKVSFTGKIRNKGGEWMPFTSEQYNFLDSSARLFFIKAKMKSMPVGGYHSYKNGTAFMDIRLFSLFNVQYQAGKEMGISETVTFFNDMCCMAPATLIDKRIEWLKAEDEKVLASFTNNGITIQAWLYFNEKGELVNFISNDRYAVTDDGLRQMQWSTPTKEYKNYSGYNLASGADAIYTYPDGNFTYGTFMLKDVTYNTQAYR